MTAAGGDGSSNTNDGLVDGVGALGDDHAIRPLKAQRRDPRRKGDNIEGSEISLFGTFNML